MAAGSGFFDREMASQAVMAADGRVGSYFASSAGHGFAQFVQNAGGGGPAAGLVVPDVGSLAAAGVGVAPASFTGYGAVAAGAVLPVAIAAPSPPRAGAAGQAAAPFKGAWTKEEDETLREMVRAHGDRKWAAIARYLPGRIGKQCRERWINHLLPGIKKDVWTEEEDRALIEAHRSCGNRWSVIAQHLPGRSENSVKNHWNATKRGLKSKRRLKKKNGEQQAAAAPAGQQLSLLAEYIRSLYPATAGSSTAPPLATSSPPVSDNHGYTAGLAAANVAAAAAAAATVAGMGMYHSDPANMGTTNLINVPQSALPDLSATYSGGGLPEGRYSYYLPSFAQVNLHYAGLRVPPPLPLQPPQMISAQDVLHAAAYANMNLYPFADHQNLVASNADVEFDRESSTNQGNAGGSGGYYYGYGGYAGPNSAGGGGDAEEMEVVQMDPREFSAREQDVVTLDLTRFR